MAIVDNKYIESTDGIKKTIDKGSMGMALDILQRGLYAFPIQSTVRELASNCYDAVKEREVAKGILSGTTSVEDHYDVTKIDGIFHASGWDPTYFDLSWLSDDPYVYLYYEEGVQKDMLRMVDHGVGLGKTRLVNYFMLNWSSKRANKDSLGRFGLGSKVALSLGVDSFRVITKYNGRKFKFDVFLDKVESIIPKFSAKGQANEPFVLVPEKTVTEDDGTVTEVPAYVAYCEETTDKNGVEIQIEVKKHNKKLFFEAIKAQLMYMPDIKFLVKEEGKSIHTEEPIAAVILYRDENVIISQSTVFNKPHVLLGTGNALINYGFVSFKDLEIEPKNGSVGLIMDINEIEVTPSRESPMWTAKTRAAVLAKYRKVSEMASTYLNKELSMETDYIKWIIKASQIIGAMRHGGSNDSVLSRLASIIDLDDIGEVTFPGDSRVVFDTKPRTLLGEALTVRVISYDSYRHKVERKLIDDLVYLSKPKYFTKLASNPFRDRYINEEKGQFVLFNIKENATIDKLGKYVLASTELIDYDTVDIPQDRMDLYLSEAQGLSVDDGTGTAVTVPTVDYAATRKVNKQIVLHMLSGVNGAYDYKFSSEDVYISDLFGKFTDKLVIYTTGGDREALSNLLAVFPKAMLSLSTNSDLANMKAVSIMPLATENRILGVLIAQENVKYIQGSSKYMSMSDVMLKSYDKKTEKLVFSDLLKYAATNSVISSLAQEYLGKRWEVLSYTQVSNIDPKLQLGIKFLASYMQKTAYNNGPPRDIMSRPGFLRDVVQYQLYSDKVLEASDETIEDLKKSINTNVPDYLCDSIDDINIVDIVDIDVIKEWIDVFKYYSKYMNLLYLYASHSSYDTATLKESSIQLKEICRVFNSLEP
jgi:hypothetical protein